MLRGRRTQPAGTPDNYSQLICQTPSDATRLDATRRRPATGERKENDRSISFYRSDIVSGGARLPNQSLSLSPMQRRSIDIYVTVCVGPISPGQYLWRYSAVPFLCMFHYNVIRSTLVISNAETVYISCLRLSLCMFFFTAVSPGQYY